MRTLEKSYISLMFIPWCLLKSLMGTVCRVQCSLKNNGVYLEYFCKAPFFKLLSTNLDSQVFEDFLSNDKKKKTLDSLILTSLLFLFPNSPRPNHTVEKSSPLDLTEVGRECVCVCLSSSSGALKLKSCSRKPEMIQGSLMGNDIKYKTHVSA